MGESGISDRDRGFLRLAVDRAREARRAGDEAFGTVLVSGDGEVLFSDRNRVVTGGSPLLHPEFTAAGWALANLGVRERARCTVYTSGEHCPMCAAAHGWAGLGRIVYASSAGQFATWAREDGRPAAPVAPLGITDVVPGAVVDGPDPELAREVRELHRP
ncbi:nucleoside deaminase [Corynebacterium kalidii]